MLTANEAPSSVQPQSPFDRLLQRPSNDGAWIDPRPRTLSGKSVPRPLRLFHAPPCPSVPLHAIHVPLASATAADVSRAAPLRLAYVPFAPLQLKIPAPCFSSVKLCKHLPHPCLWPACKDRPAQ